MGARRLGGTGGSPGRRILTGACRDAQTRNRAPGLYTFGVPLILFNKPCGVLCQFTGAPPTLADFISVKGVYPAGRLDKNSEGLLLLTDDGRLQARISEPGHKLVKCYWVQVEGEPSTAQIARLKSGVELADGPAGAVGVRRIDEPAGLWPRVPPIRRRRNIPTAWLDIALDEGRNRQVRRMTASVGLPTLRLIRHRIGPWRLGALRPGETRRVSNRAAWRKL